MNSYLSQVYQLVMKCTKTHHVTKAEFMQFSADLCLSKTTTAGAQPLFAFLKPQWLQ